MSRQQHSWLGHVALEKETDQLTLNLWNPANPVSGFNTLHSDRPLYYNKYKHNVQHYFFANVHAFVCILTQCCQYHMLLLIFCWASCSHELNMCLCAWLITPLRTYSVLSCTSVAPSPPCSFALLHKYKFKTLSCIILHRNETGRTFAMTMINFCTTVIILWVSPAPLRQATVFSEMALQINCGIPAQQ